MRNIDRIAEADAMIANFSRIPALAPIDAAGRH